MDWKKLELTWQYVEKWAAETPDAEALVFEETRLSWADFKRNMDLVAKAFMEAGSSPGTSPPRRCRAAIMSVGEPR